MLSNCYICVSYFWAWISCAGPGSDHSQHSAGQAPKLENLYASERKYSILPSGGRRAHLGPARPRCGLQRLGPASENPTVASRPSCGLQRLGPARPRCGLQRMGLARPMAMASRRSRVSYLKDRSPTKTLIRSSACSCSKARLPWDSSMEDQLGNYTAGETRVLDPHNGSGRQICEDRHKHCQQKASTEVLESWHGHQAPGAASSDGHRPH
jgi:hypothetical protein